MADDAFKVLSKICDSDLELMGFNPKFGRPEWMILQNLPVAPPCVRPSVQMPGQLQYRAEDDLTYAYAQIIKVNNQIKKQIEIGSSLTAYRDLIDLLQFFCAALMDNDMSPSTGGKMTHKSGGR